MEHKHEGSQVLVKLDRGEEVIGALTDFCRDHEVSLASLSGIGAVSNTEIGYYHLPSYTYETKVVTEICELLSLSGNVALVNGEPFVHAHAVLGQRDMSTLGGHLVRATVAVTAEVVLECWHGSAMRELDPEVKLKLLRL